MSNEKIKNDDGLPEVAQGLREKKPVLLAMFGVIFIAGFGMFHFMNKPKNKVVSPIDESYTVQQSSQSDPLKPQPGLPQSVNSNATPQINPVLVQQQMELILAKKNELQQRLSAPLMLVNNAQPNKADAPVQAGVTSADGNTQFMNQVSGQAVETVSATTVGSQSQLIAEGSLIHAILETATNSDLPGYLRATVSEPCYSEDGTQVLIPPGSRLIGQYKSGMLQGQSRIFIVWTRLITPSGISIQLGSPGVDSLGVAGIGADDIDRHFWQRFGTASLLSMIGTGSANAGVSATDQANSASVYRSAMANSFAASANESLQQDSKISPTLTTYQGKPIMVFVAKDLNFQRVAKQIKSKLNVF